MTDDTHLCLIDGMSEKHKKHDWEVAAKGLLKSEMVQREFDYNRLSIHMENLGLQNVSANNLKSKINRGTFSAAFFIQALIAMGCEEITIKNLPIRKKLTTLPHPKDNSHHSAISESMAIHETPPGDYVKNSGKDK